MNTTRRVATAVAAVGLGVTMLAGCSSSTGSSESSGAVASPESTFVPQLEPTAGTLPPVIIEPDQTKAEVKVGEFVDIVVPEDAIEGTTVESEQFDLIEMIPAYADGSGAIFNPGGRALAPGTAVLTVTNPDGTTRKITLTITE